MERYYALQILIDYQKHHTYINIALNNLFQKHDLSKQVKDHITVRVYGTIQNLLYIQYQLEPFLKKQPKVTERMLLYMSMYEHLFMDIPDYAIVNESVELIKKIKGKHSANFINAVLKNSFKRKRLLDDLELNHYLSIKYSIPKWIINMFIKQYGIENTKRIIKTANEIPYHTVRVNTLKTTKEELLKDKDFKEGLLTHDSLIYKGNIINSDYYRKGLITIQDESSQRVIEILDPKENESVLDMCSAPGSKTTYISQKMHNTGHIDAYDLYEHKAKLIQDNVNRLGCNNISIYVKDALEIEENKEYDRILLDGPCSGLGLLRRKPEIRYQKSTNMDELIILQEKLLEKSYVLLKKNGNIVYSTCTLNKKENNKQIQKFIYKHPDMEVLYEETILPDTYHSDGFYICLMKKHEIDL